MGENRHEEGRKRDTVVGIIKESVTLPDFTSWSFQQGATELGKLRIGLPREQNIFSTNGIKGVLVIQQSISPEAFMSIIYSEFIGSPWKHTTHAKEEFLKMKLDDVNLKQVFLNSFPESLGNEAYRALEARNVTLAQTTLGELYQLILNALAKLCNQKKLLAEFEELENALEQHVMTNTRIMNKVHSSNPFPHVLPIQYPPLPLAKIHLLTDAYAKPIGHVVVGVVMDSMHRLFVASITPPIFNINSIKQRLIQTCCASSHTEFLTKHPSPLWLNPSFFVSLPFKQNEDVNPTKASHPGMNPEHYQLAKEECEQLVSQGIIEPTTSPWACEAFYVNKRSEQVRGKLRLVINYQPLNHFLADDKFLLPQKKSLFQHLAYAKVLSKFDLKSGFWQLGIRPEDRLKMAF
ncbi:hypothetical protein Tco_0671903 [Tanacetum coccineum]